MGRRPVVPSSDDFLPGVSLDDIWDLAGQDPDPKNVKRYLAAHHRKKGRTLGEIAEIINEPYANAWRWIARMEKMGLAGIPRGLAKGASRKMAREQRVVVVKDANAGPSELGYEADVWTIKDLWRHAKEVHGMEMGYSTFARNCKEMGIVVKMPRPRNPKAATEEERVAFQRATRKAIQKYARLGFLLLCQDEAHIQAYCNAYKTVGLRGIELVADSSVAHARLTVFGGAGDGFFYVSAAIAGNGKEFIKFCNRLFELFGKVQLLLDHAGYHTSDAVKAFVKENSHRLKLHFTLKYTPNDNVVESQWPFVKAAIGNKQIHSRSHIDDTIGKSFKAGEMRPVKSHDFTRVTTRRVDKKEARKILAKTGENEYFCYEETEFNKRVRIPTADDLRRERESILPPERRAELPEDLANSDLPDKFLANVPLILLRE